MSDPFEGSETAPAAGRDPVPPTAGEPAATEHAGYDAYDGSGDGIGDDEEVVRHHAAEDDWSRSPAWVGTLTGAGLGLVTIQALVLLGTFTQALAVTRFQGNIGHKIGVALLSNVGSANGLTVLVAAVVAALPTLLRAPVAEPHRRRQALVYGIGAVVAVLLIVGTPAAVWARIHVLHVGGQEVDALARRVLATYVAGTLGTALVALAACLGLSRYSKTVTPSP